MTEEQIRQIIEEEIIVDAYDDDEVNMGWYYFIAEGLSFPFQAMAKIKKRDGSTEEYVGTVVEDATDEERFRGETFYVHIDYKGTLMKIEIRDLTIVDATTENHKVIEIWKFWLDGKY